MQNNSSSSNTSWNTDLMPFILAHVLWVDFIIVIFMFVLVTYDKTCWTWTTEKKLQLNGKANWDKKEQNKKKERKKTHICGNWGNLEKECLKHSNQCLITMLMHKTGQRWQKCLFLPLFLGLVFILVLGRIRGEGFHGVLDGFTVRVDTRKVF